MSSDDSKLVRYTINLSDLIIEVSASWNSFALENQGHHLVEKNIIGKSVWEYISDAETRHIYKNLVEKVRMTGESVNFPFRCDSPDKIRSMNMTITMGYEDLIVFHSRIIHEEGRANVDLIDETQPRSDDVIEICSWCKMVRTNGSWLDAADAVRALNLFDHLPLPRLTHSICPICMHRFND